MTEAEQQLQEKLPQIWDDLVLKSKNIDASLVKVKTKFTEVCEGNRPILVSVDFSGRTIQSRAISTNYIGNNFTEPSAAISDKRDSIVN